MTDASTSSATWTKVEDHKLLLLVQLMPSQWETVATIVGRTAADCESRHEGLLRPAAVPSGVSPTTETCGDNNNNNSLDVSNNTNATFSTFEDEEQGVGEGVVGGGASSPSSSLMKSIDMTREAGDDPIFMEFADSQGNQDRAGVVTKQTKRRVARGILCVVFVLLAVTVALVVGGGGREANETMGEEGNNQNPNETQLVDNTKDTDSSMSNVSATSMTNTSATSNMPPTMKPTVSPTEETTEEVKPDFDEQVGSAESIVPPIATPVAEGMPTAAPTVEQTEETTAAIFPELVPET